VTHYWQNAALALVTIQTYAVTGDFSRTGAGRGCLLAYLGRFFL